MQNLQDYQSWKYVAAERLQYKYQDMLNLHWKFFLSFVNLGFGLLLHFCGILVKIVMPEVPKNISGQLALVTGGANGLGREIARCLAKEKCNIVICDLDIENAEKTAKEIESEFGVTTKAYKVDVSDFEAVDNLKKSIEEDVGFVDILVNNAGVMAITSLREGKPSDYKKIFDINVMSSFWTCRAFLNGMIERKRGHIVAIASMSAFIPAPLAISYTSSKFAVRGFMLALYDELYLENSHKFVNLTTVYPTFINTRKELIDRVESSGTFLKLQPSSVAEQVLKGVLYNRESVVAPAYFSLFTGFTTFMPRDVFAQWKAFFLHTDLKTKNEK